MELSIWSSYHMELSPEDAILRLKQKGIYCTELSDEHGKVLIDRGNPVETGKAFGQFAKENGIKIVQGHMWLQAKICTMPDAVDILKDWIDLYHAIGIKSAVLHGDYMLGMGLNAQEIINKNVEKLKELTDYIGDRDFTICLENLRGSEPGNTFFDSAEGLLSVINLVGSDKLGITLDTGHLNLTKATSQREFILTAGEKLKAIHIANNDGTADQHLSPFERGDVDFFEVVRTLREVGFAMPLNYENPGDRAYCPIELRDAKIDFFKQGFEHLMKNA